MTTTRDHLSIGEVLELLQEEFPDITISKIRFLESQGLLDPERTPSGYRKFYDTDIKRLRWILQQQQENFLPLKVIRERLDSGESLEAEIPLPEPAEPPEPEAKPSNRRRTKRGRSKKPLPSIFAGGDVEDPLATSTFEVSMTRGELAAAAGLDDDAVNELEEFGLIRPTDIGAGSVFDGDALVIAKAAAQFQQHGLEARHLRSYKVAAEREAGLLEQAVMPTLKHRGVESQQKAADTLSELARLGGQVRAAVLRSALRGHLRRSGD